MINRNDKGERTSLISSVNPPPIYVEEEGDDHKEGEVKPPVIYVEIPINDESSPLFCFLSRQKLVNPYTTRTGTTFSHNAISDWLNGNLANNVEKRNYDPINRYPLKYSNDTLRKNNWLNNILTNKNKTKIIKKKDANGNKIKVLCIDVVLLNNPATGKPFFHPTLNEEGEMVENYDLRAWFPNFIYLKIKTAAIEQRKIDNEVSMEALPQPPAYSAEEMKVQIPAPNVAVVIEDQQNHAIDPLDQDAINAIIAANALDAAEAAARVGNQNQEDRQEEPLNFNFNAEDRANRLQPQVLRENLDQWRFVEKTEKACVTCINTCCCLVCCGGTVAGVYFLVAYLEKLFHDQTKCQEPNTTINYTFEIPWTTGGKICVNNDYTDALVISKFSTTIFAQVYVDKAWGSLIENSVRVASDPGPDGSRIFSVDYRSPNYLTIPAKGLACMEYNFDSTTQPNSDLFTTIGMNPKTVEITLVNPATQDSAESTVNEVLNLKNIHTCAPNPIPNYVLGTWFPSYAIYLANFTVNDIPVNQVNEIKYFNIGFDAPSGFLLSIDPNADLQNLPALALRRIQYPYLKTLITFGGYCSNPQFTRLTSNSFSLNNFATQVAKAIRVLQMDGVSIDWEDCGDGILPDVEKINLLLKTLREQATQQPFLVTAALPAGSAKLAAMSASGLCQMANLTDYLNVMTYDYAGGWSQDSGYLAPLYVLPNGTDSVANTIAILKNLNCIPATKLHLGIPTYGRAVIVTTLGNTFGYNQSVVSVPQGQFDSIGIFLYKCISTGMCDKGISLPNDFTIIATPQNSYGNGNTTAFQPIGYSASNKMFVSFDDTNSVSNKTAFAVAQGLGGIHFWDASGDVRSNCSTEQGKQFGLGCTALEVLNTPPIVNNATQQNATNIANTTQLTEFFAQLPEELSIKFQEALRDGILTSFLLTLTEDTLTTYLTQEGWSKEKIAFVNLTLRSLTMLYMGSIISSTAGSVVHLLVSELGFSNHTATTLSLATVIATSALESSVSIPTKLAIMAAGAVGSYTGSALARFGMWASDKVVEQVRNVTNAEPIKNNFSPV